MKFNKFLIASAALFAVMGANAQVAVSLGDLGTPMLTLSSAGLSDASFNSIATLAGGTVYSASVPSVATEPLGTVGNFLAAGPDSGNTATLSFQNGGVSAVSFLWGTPDNYNDVTVTTTTGSQTFNSGNVSGLTFDGTDASSGYVTFSADSGAITALSFTTVPSTNAFETSNYEVTPVPEPGTYALMLGGLGIVGFVARRRRAA